MLSNFGNLHRVSLNRAVRARRADCPILRDGSRQRTTRDKTLGQKLTKPVTKTRDKNHEQKLGTKPRTKTRDKNLGQTRPKTCDKNLGEKKLGQTLETKEVRSCSFPHQQYPALVRRADSILKIFKRGASSPRVYASSVDGTVGREAPRSGTVNNI